MVPNQNTKLGSMLGTVFGTIFVTIFKTSFLEGYAPATGPLSVWSCWLVDCWSGARFVPQTETLETLMLHPGYAEDHFGEPGVHRDAKQTP